MTDIMKLADDYARSPLCARQDGVIPARTALQSAIEAMAAECAEHKENAIRNARIAVSIKAERDQLQAENERLSKLFQGDVRIKDIGFKPNLHMDFEGGPVRVMAECFADYFRQSEAENYIEMLLSSEDGLELVATIQRKSGKSPHQLRQQVEAERDALQAKLDAMGKGAPDGNALLQAIARGWCSEKNSGKVMDALLALAIRDEVQKLYAAPKALAPLTRKQISDLDEEGVFLGNIYEITKEIEAAHGIGGAP